MEDEKITKKDIEEIVDGAIEKFAVLVNQGFSEQTKLMHNLDAKIDSVKDELNNKIDGIVSGNDNIAKEIQDMRAEQAAIIGGNQRIGDTLMSHEDRITELEIHTNLKPAKALA